MGKLKLVELADEMAASVAGVTVEQGEMHPFLLELERVLPMANDSLAQVWTNLRNRMGEEMPLHPAVVAFVESLAAAQQQIGRVAAEFPSVIRSIHARDMERHENPRVNEGAWNV